MLRLAVIGFGRRSASVIRTMQSLRPDLQVVAIADSDVRGVRSRCRSGGRDANIVSDECQYFDDEDALLACAENFEGIMIGTPCCEHSRIACKVAETGLPLFLEKPVAITHNQLNSLAMAFKGKESRVLVSFPLRATPLFSAVHEIVKSGRLGRINQVQATNNVPYGGCYFSQWYRDYDRVGGLWLQKTTHDFDYLNYIINARPLMLSAVTSQRIYGGSKPHQLRCSACTDRDVCIESDKAIALRGDSGGLTVPEAEDTDHLCCFSREIRNQDAGSALVVYENGVHLSYTQNFVSRRSAGRRGAIVTGHLATLSFDWTTEKIKVIEHQKSRVDEIEVCAEGGHAGGDLVLAGHFIEMMRGGPNPSTGLEAGIVSAAMCLAARDAANNLTFQPVSIPGISGEAPHRDSRVNEVVTTY